MARFGRHICVSAIVAVALATGATAAAASTFYVSTGGSDAHACNEPAAPCRTIAAAIAKSEEAPGAATIEVGPGIYEEALSLSTVGAVGMTINGAGDGLGGTEIEGASGASHPTVA